MFDRIESGAVEYVELNGIKAPKMNIDNPIYLSVNDNEIDTNEAITSVENNIGDKMVEEEIKINILSKDELATILWALDYRMDSVLHENSIDEEDLVAQKKLYEQLNKVYLKIHEMWEKTNTSCEFCEEEVK